mgnify:FL=1
MHKAQFGEVESIKKPPHYEAIHQLALDIVNANNKQQEWVAYNQIKEICDKFAGTPLDHPFQWETLADFTYHNPEIALSYYFKALELARLFKLEDYLASINFAIAENYLEKADKAQALNFANTALTFTEQAADNELQLEINELIIEADSLP